MFLWNVVGVNNEEDLADEFCTTHKIAKTRINVLFLLNQTFICFELSFTDGIR